jgi:phosphotriesterase-related protein
LRPGLSLAIGSASGDNHRRNAGTVIVIRTVTGDITAIAGCILAHEHLQIDLSDQKGPLVRIGAEEEDAVVDDLRHAKEFGLAAITDLSAPGFGRDPPALRRISERSGIAVVCAAGFYWDPFPEVAINGSVEALRDTMIAEIEAGVAGVRCGVIKVGTHRGTPDAVAERTFRAAAAASRATGAPVITHTSSPDQSAWHLRVLGQAGMDMRRVVISHMGAARSVDELVEAGRSGAFLGVDKVASRRGPRTISSLIWCATPARVASSGRSSCPPTSPGGPCCDVTAGAATRRCSLISCRCCRRAA